MSEAQIDLNAPVGTEELPRLEAKPVLVQGVRVDTKTKKDSDKVIGQIVVLICKHPDKEDLMEFGQVKRLKNNVAKVVGLWYQLDKEKKIQKGTVLADAMSFFGVSNLNEFIGKSLPTVKQSDDSDYLCLKAY